MNKTVNVSVANMYKQPNYRSETTNQVLLGETVEILKNEKNFLLVKQNDGYEGWINEYQLCNSVESSQAKMTVTSHIIKIYEKPDLQSLPVRDAVFGCRLVVMDEKNDWYLILLPDGKQGWSQKIYFGEFPHFNRQNVVEMAKQFLGCPYYWGGRSPKGFDCSGLVQTVFTLLGKRIRRDTPLQMEDCKFISNKPLDAQVADLVFFGDIDSKVDHVAISLGNGKIIHSRGMVQINSFLYTDDEYDQKLEETLIAVSTVF